MVTTLFSEPAAGTFFSIGVTPVTIVAADSSGNADTCSFTVTVTDSEAPVIYCPQDLTVSTEANECGAYVDFDISVMDNCSIANVNYSPISGTFFPLGSSIVSVAAQDSAGNVDSCSFLLIVEDIVPPVVSCPDNIVVWNDSGSYGAIVDFNASASDNCALDSIIIEPSSGSQFPLGETSVKVVAVDSSENSDSCGFLVTVVLQDADSDSLPDWDDNCPLTYNPDQLDTDSNGVGDACCCQLRGNVDNIVGAGGGIDVADLTYLVAFLFTGGPAPPCPEQGNVDGVTGVSNTIDIADLTYLVSFLFQGSSFPPACH
jgi:hypothetical protein